MKGCSYIRVFIAGARNTGFFRPFYVLVKSQALKTWVSRLSHSPWESLARVLADRGAMSMASAHLRS